MSDSMGSDGSDKGAAASEAAGSVAVAAPPGSTSVESPSTASATASFPEGSASAESGRRAGGSSETEPKEASASPAELEASATRYEEAFEALLPEFQALPEERVKAVNLDVPTAVQMVIPLMRRIRELRPSIVKLLAPDYDMRRFDMADEYAYALGYAHGLYLIASDPVEVVEPAEPLAKEAVEVRRALIEDAKVLVRRKLLPEQTLTRLQMRTGYQDLGFELLALYQAFRMNWSKIEGKTAVTLEELHEAQWLGARLLHRAGERKLQKATLSEATVLRRRAFTLFIEAYEEVRRLVYFARWFEGDAEQIAPSLYSVNARAASAGSDTPDTQGGGQESPAPSTVATSGPSAVGAVPTDPNALSAPRRKPPVREGFPGGSPFMDDDELSE